MCFSLLSQIKGEKKTIFIFYRETDHPTEAVPATVDRNVVSVMLVMKKMKREGNFMHLMLKKQQLTTSAWYVFMP